MCAAAAKFWKPAKCWPASVWTLRSGDVVLSTGQPLTMAKVAIPDPEFARQATEDVLRQANAQAYQRVLPGGKA